MKFIHLFCYEHIVIVALFVFFSSVFYPLISRQLNKQVNGLLLVCWTWRGKGYIQKSPYSRENTIKT